MSWPAPALLDHANHWDLECWAQSRREAAAPRKGWAGLYWAVEHHRAGVSSDWHQWQHRQNFLTVALWMPLNTLSATRCKDLFILNYILAFSKTQIQVHLFQKSSDSRIHTASSSMNLNHESKCCQTRPWATSFVPHLLQAVLFTGQAWLFTLKGKGQLTGDNRWPWWGEAMLKMCSMTAVSNYFHSPTYWFQGICHYPVWQYHLW